MQPRTSILSACTLSTAMAFGVAAMAADLPKEGTFSGTASNPVGKERAALAWRDWEKSDLISAVSAACAIAVFAFGIWQYRSSENWKRSEFVAAQVKEFNSDKINRAVLLMMDYDPARVELFPERANVNNRYVDVTFMMLVKAIGQEQDLTEAEFQIRIYFEHFLQSLARFSYFLDVGAIKPQELCADFRYPIALMAGTARDMKLKNTGVDIKPFVDAVHDYLTRWEYTDITDFEQKIHKACDE
jgi:hypothetical protein